MKIKSVLPISLALIMAVAPVCTADTASDIDMTWSCHEGISAACIDTGSSESGCAVGKAGALYIINEGTGGITPKQIGGPTGAGSLNYAGSAVTVMGQEALAFGNNGSIAWIRYGSSTLSYSNIDSPTDADLTCADAWGSKGNGYAIAGGTHGSIVKLSYSGSMPVARNISTNAGTDAEIHGVDVVDSRTVWLCGDDGLLMKSTNAGESWTKCSTGNSDDLVQVSFADTTNGAAADSAGYLYITENGGSTWDKIPGPGGSLSGVISLGNSEYLAANDSGHVYVKAGENDWREVLQCTGKVIQLTRSTASGRIYVLTDDGNLYTSDDMLTSVFMRKHIRISVDGNIITGDVEPFIQNSRTMVPVRFVTEELGCDVEWINSTRQVKISKGDRTITLKIGSNIATVKNGSATKTVTLDSPALIKNSRTFMPVRFVAETFNRTVSWDNTKRLVEI